MAKSDCFRVLCKLFAAVAMSTNFSLGFSCLTCCIIIVHPRVLMDVCIDIMTQAMRAGDLTVRRAQFVAEYLDMFQT